MSLVDCSLYAAYCFETSRIKYNTFSFNGMNSDYSTFRCEFSSEMSLVNCSLCFNMSRTVPLQRVAGTKTSIS